MKIAICFSGMIRSGLEAYPSILRYIGDLYANCDFFIHTWDIDYYNALYGEDYEEYCKNYAVKGILNLEKFNKLNDLFKFKYYKISNYHDTQTNIKQEFKKYLIKEKWWIPWAYSWNQSILLKKKYEKRYNIQYDIVVKLRTDLIFDPNLRLIDTISKVKNREFGVNTVYQNIPDDIIFLSDSRSSDLASEWWSDRIITGTYMDNSIAEMQYFAKFLEKKQLKIVDLGLKYLGEGYKIGLLREECLMFDPISNYSKCCECDKLLYHVFKEDDIKNLTQKDLTTITSNTLKIRQSLSKNLNEYFEKVKWT